MADTFRKGLYLIGPDHRGRWVLLVALAVVVSVFEAVGAGFVFVIVGMVTGVQDGLVVPVIGDLRRLLPAADLQDAFAPAAVLMAAFFLLRAGLLAGQVYTQYRMTENAAARLAVRLLRGYLRAPYNFHLRRNSAELIRNVYDTVRVFEHEVLTPAVKVLAHAWIVLGLLAVLLATSVFATLLAVAGLAPLALFLLLVIHPRVKALGVTSQEVSRTSLQTVQQSLGAWRDIKLLGRNRYFEDEFARRRFRLARVRYLRSTAGEMPRVVIETVLVLFVLAFLGLMAIVYDDFRTALPVLGLFGYAALRLQPSLNKIFQSLNYLKFAGPAVDDLYRDAKIVEHLTITAPATVAPEPLPFTRELRLEGVSFRYEGTDDDALSAVDLTVARHEAVGVVGPTGGGKSTLVDIAIGLLEPTAGRVLIDGHDLRGNEAAWQQNIGMVPQNVYLIDDTLRRNIALGLPDTEIDEARLRETVEMAQLETFVAALPAGLDTVVGERGIRLSGGQRQRVAIARALYRQPTVLVLDEGTSALDNVTEAAFIRTLRGLHRDRTLILVAHRLTTVRFCDRIVVVKDGQVVDTGAYDELEARNADFQALVTGGAG